MPSCAITSNARWPTTGATGLSEAEARRKARRAVRRSRADRARTAATSGARGGSRIWSPTCATVSGCSRTAGRSRPSPCCRWRWASARTPPSSRWSTACSCGRCRCREPERLVQLDGDSTTNPIWEQIQSRQQQLFAGATRLVGPAVRSVAGRRGQAGRGAVGQRRVLRGPRRHGRSSAGPSRPRTIAAVAAPSPRSPSSATPSGSAGSAAPPTSLAGPSPSTGCRSRSSA